MKKTLLSLFVAATAAFTATAQTNLVKNGDFENWNADGALAEWAALTTKDVPTATNITTKQVEGRSGKGAEVPSLKGKSGLQNTRLTQRIALAAGEYTITFWAKGSVDGNIAYAGHVEEKDGKLGTYKYQAKPGVALSTTEWTQVTYDFKLASDAAVYVIARNDKGVEGSIFVDDFTLVAKGDTPQPEPQPQPQPEPQPQPQPEQPAAGVIYENAFDQNIEGWTFDNVNLPSALKYVWQHDTKYKQLKGSAYYKQTYAAEAIAVSPEIQLGPNNKLTFEHAANKMGDLKPADAFTLLVREGQTGEWKTLTIPTYPAGTNWDFVSAGEIDLSAYNNKKVQFGFKYTSTDSVAGTWEIKNFKVTGNPTAISTATAAPAVEAIYDLSGRRVSNAAKGLLIVNGKKVVR